MTAVIKCRGFAGGFVCEFIGHYLKTNNFEAGGGRGASTFTPFIEEAMKFPDKSAAFQYWMTPSKTVPLRPDGKANRPLTAYHITIEEIEPEQPTKLRNRKK